MFFDKIKNLLIILFEILIHAATLNLNTNKKIIHIIKLLNHLVLFDLYKLYDIISLLSDDF